MIAPREEQAPIGCSSCPGLDPGIHVFLSRLSEDVNGRAAGEIELNVPAGRFGEPDEIAAVVTLLGSTQASYLAGTMIPIHGGFLRLDLK
jgi:NAD(P)-dependent dehydrogenase (short-subunit alcohol dehydrogenase family)